MALACAAQCHDRDLPARSTDPGSCSYERGRGLAGETEPEASLLLQRNRGYAKRNRPARGSRPYFCLSAAQYGARRIVRYHDDPFGEGEAHGVGG